MRLFFDNAGVVRRFANSKGNNRKTTMFFYEDEKKIGTKNVNVDKWIPDSIANAGHGYYLVVYTVRICAGTLPLLLKQPPNLPFAESYSF